MHWYRTKLPTMSLIRITSVLVPIQSRLLLSWRLVS
jgi:hypothetical protein